MAIAASHPGTEDEPQPRWRLFSPHDTLDLRRRLDRLPRKGLPLKARVVVHWDVHHIPFIEAQEDADLAVALGVIHVHLRWGQMEIMRRAALGRVSEMIGPLGVGLDTGLRTLGLARTASAIAAILPAETTRWLGHFVAGINHAIETAAVLPPEFRLLGIGREPWRIEDVLAVGRLAAADSSWASLIPMLQEDDDALVRELWRRASGLEAVHAAPQPPPGGRSVARLLLPWLTRAGGSNSLAVAPSRSASGGALIASDPHLPAMLPDPFLIAGYKSPSFHLVGLMIPGLPFVASGRNPWIAWGCTNLHAASSDLFDVSDVPAHATGERRERLRVRWWRERTAIVREALGDPIVSDLAIFPRSRRGTFALRWVGSLPSDEMTAMLNLNRARNWREFRAALEGLAVPGLTMTYADAEGHIGKAMAVRLPRRPVALPDHPVRPRDDAVWWQTFVRSSDLPAELDPKEGVVVSANEKPSGAASLVGYIFSPGNRSIRLRELLDSKPLLSLQDLGEIQQDVTAPASALAVRDKVVRALRLTEEGAGGGAVRDLVRALEDWDGRYATDSRGAAVFELLVFHLVRTLAGRKRQVLYDAIWNGWDLACADIAAAGPNFAEAARKAAGNTARRLVDRTVWGDLHRLRLMHPLGLFQPFGRRYRFGDWPAAGASETVLRTTHPATTQRHHVGLAPAARHLSDLSSLDANHFVLLGGQDGWLGSTTMLDQVPLWRTGRYIQVPLDVDTVRRTFPVHLDLLP